MEKCTLKFPPEQLTILSAGGFGIIYLQPDNTVLKAIVNPGLCNEAKVELIKQKKIYDAFNDLKKIKSDDPLVKLVQENVIISEPIESCDNEVNIGGKSYSCFFTMSRLRGLPLEIYKNTKEESLSKIKKNFIKDKGMNFEIMAHLAFNSEIGGFYGTEFSKTKISDDNPPRGYFIIENDNMLDLLRSNYKLSLSNEQLKQIIGFIYGWIFYKTKIVPIDIEITLGYYDGIFKINVLDFGMTFDIADFTNNISNVRTVRFFDIINDKEKILERTIVDVSIDLYCDIDEDKMCMSGWNIAEKLSKEQYGGNSIYHKYLKYKVKYISLKKVSNS